MNDAPFSGDPFYLVIAVGMDDTRALLGCRLKKGSENAELNLYAALLSGRRVAEMIELPGKPKPGVYLVEVAKSSADGEPLMLHVQSMIPLFRSPTSEIF